MATSWSPRPPQQPPSRVVAPRCIESWRDITLPAAVSKISAFLELTRMDLTDIVEQLERGVAPELVACPNRPKPIAVVQTEVHSWAVGRVYDCTEGHSNCCVVADYNEPLRTHLQLDFLRWRLGSYPDQALAGYLLDGVQLKADVELQAVFVSHLNSLPMGWGSSMKKLHRKSELAWYEQYDDLSIFPSYWHGKGAAARKLEPWRWRETTEGGGPRTDTFDASGLKAISSNEASRIHHMPQFFLTEAAEQPTFAAWLLARGLPRLSEPSSQSPHRRFSKWPKEVNPSLLDVMRDTAVLKRAGQVADLAVYGFGDDFKDHFNQLTMCPTEW